MSVPRVGETHPVLCVWPAKRLRWQRVRGWVPVYGTLHEDAEIIRFPHDHWHVDWRFVSEPQWLRLRAWMERCHDPVSFVHGYVVEPDKCVMEIRRRMRMLREMPPHPAEGVKHRKEARPPHWQQPLEDAMEGLRASCGVCPHRGLPLGCRRDKNGHHVCTGHGLTWHKTTGELVRRTERRLP